MAKQPSEEIRRMLEAIREIKSEYYVGTQEAYNAIKVYARVYETPKKVADEINKNASIDARNYHATPERLVGLVNALNIIDEDYFEELFFVKDPLADFILKRNKPKLSSFQINFSDIVISDKYRDAYREFVFDHHLLEQYEKIFEIDFLKKYFLKTSSELFSQASEEGIRTDKEFGEFFANLVYNGLKEREIEIDEDEVSKEAKKLKDRGLEELLAEMQNKIESLPFSIYTTLQNINFENLCSRENYSESLREYARNEMNGNLVISEMIKRLKRDQLDHRLEHRRSILAALLTRNYSENTSYEEIVNFWERKSSYRKRGLESLERLRAPKDVINTQKALIQEAIFLRQLLGSEKNWVVKFLKS